MSSDSPQICIPVLSSRPFHVISAQNSPEGFTDSVGRSFQVLCIIQRLKGKVSY